MIAARVPGFEVTEGVPLYFGRESLAALALRGALAGRRATCIVQA